MLNLEDQFNQMQRSADIAFVSNKGFFIPGLFITGVEDEIAFPILPNQIKEILKISKQAPYGKGEKTIIDTNVRNCKEIDASCIAFKGEKWQSFIKGLLHDAEDFFEFEGGSLEVDLYKMLIYEKGGFFKSHQDSEKITNMFGTLVICLPSKHTGGELVITHPQKKSTVVFESTQNAGGYDFKCVLFYADCYHELKEITSGYRVCLTYNVALRNHEKYRHLISENDDLLKESINCIDKWFKDSPDREQFIFTLDHQYTREHFSYKNLKGIDRSKADILLQAADSLGMNSYIALLERYESYDANDDFGGNYYGDSHEDVDVGELLDYSFALDRIQNKDGLLLDIRSTYLNENDIYNRTEYDYMEAIEEEYEGYTGNAGCTMDYWYLYGAVLIWPKDKEFRLVLNRDLNAAITLFHSEVCLGKSSGDGINPRDKLKDIETFFCEKRYNSLSTTCSELLFECLIKLENKNLMKKFLLEYFDLSSFHWNLVQVSCLENWYTDVLLFEILQKLLKKNRTSCTQLALELINNFSKEKLSKKEFAQKLFDMIFNLKDAYNQDCLPLFLSFAFKTNDIVIITKLIEKMVSAPIDIASATIILTSFESNKAQVSALDKEGQQVSRENLEMVFLKLKQLAGGELAPAYVPKIPSIPATANKVMLELKSFMQDAKKEQYIIKKNKEERTKIISDINYFKIDVDLSIDNSAKPYSLICTKKGFEQRKKIQKRNEALALADKYDSFIKSVFK